jgi:hypothetical protein
MTAFARSPLYRTDDRESAASEFAWLLQLVFNSVK